MNVSSNILLEDTPEGKGRYGTIACSLPGLSFIAVHILATAASDYIDSKTKSINLNITQPYEIQAMTRKLSTWSSDVVN